MHDIAYIKSCTNFQCIKFGFNSVKNIGVVLLPCTFTHILISVLLMLLLSLAHH